jgi:hypothetical protein
VQAHPFVEREGRIPPGLVAGLIVFVLVIGALAYSAGRFGRRAPSGSPVEALPPPAAPAPAAPENVPTPPDLPPTVTPSLPEVVERGSRSGRVLVEKSSQIIVPVAPAATTPRPAAFPPTPTPEDAGARRQIVVEIVNTPPPLPTPTVPELEQGDEEEPQEMPEEPEPEPTPDGGNQPGGSPVSI